ncbi:MAG: entericidin [Bacteroidetes bacterium]|nr:entericidin [Bacteroidota bacterium]MBS1932146.1 entericidin [Bacteroidota bacterium]
MKKLLLVFLVAGTFAACNSKSGGDADKKDTTATQTMSTTPAQDTTHKAADTTAPKMSADTTKK